jgi:hypothetical protein
MPVPMCQVCGACPECKHPEDYVNVTLPCIDRIVIICACCLEAISKVAQSEKQHPESSR